VKGLVLFVHGLGGSPQKTWGAFAKLIGDDPDLSARYDVEGFGYNTSIFGPTPSLQTCADALKTEIDTRYASYESIAIIAHSQGGLIAR
jgi:triacylglycerol esterase/lipase EstA (alpha/beta hydrolase family)